jgi:hypothetical protein
LSSTQPLFAEGKTAAVWEPFNKIDTASYVGEHQERRVFLFLFLDLQD